MKRTLTILALAVLLTAVFLPGKAEAASLGDDVSCYWEDEGVLHIYGSGETANFSETVIVPWNAEKESIKEVVVEPGVTGIGDYLFAGCVNLEKVTLPSTLKKIGQHAFDGCTKLTAVAIPTGVESIGAGAFAECTGIENVHIQDLSAWCHIDFGDAYANPLSRSAALCVNEKKLYNLTVPADVTQIKDFAFTGLEVTNVSFAGEVTSIGVRAFAGSTVQQISFPKTLAAIGDEAFLLSQIKSVVIPDSVKALGVRAFSRCFYLTSAQLFGGNQEAEEISSGTETFSGCTALRNLILEDGITEIGSKCCQGSALQYVFFSEDLQVIRDNAFLQCGELVEITYGGTSAKWELVQIGAGNASLSAATITCQGNNCTHSYSEWLDVDNGIHKRTCSKCGLEESGEHVYPFMTVTKDPNCSQTGEEEGYCSLCNHLKKDVLPKNDNHDYKNECDADCGRCGNLRDASHVYSNNCDEFCDKCYEKRQVEHSWNEGVVDSEPSCVVNGVIFYQCTSCGQGKTEYPPALDHDYAEEIISDGDCLNGKLIRYTCKRCPHQYTQTVSLPHDFTILESTQASTCTTKGWQTYRCQRCSATEIRYLDLDPQNHTYSQVCDSSCDECGAIRQVNHSFYSHWQYDKQGHWQECSVCHAKEDTAAHIPGPAATEESGQYCTVCGYMLQSALEHVHNLEDSLSSDASAHWFYCTGCKEKVDVQAHLYDGVCDDLCETCDTGGKRTIW